MEKNAVCRVALADGLLQSQHQLRRSKRDGNAFEDGPFDALAGFLEFDSAGCGHDVDQNFI